MFPPNTSKQEAELDPKSLTLFGKNFKSINDRTEQQLFIAELLKLEAQQRRTILKKQIDSAVNNLEQMQKFLVLDENKLLYQSVAAYTDVLADVKRAQDLDGIRKLFEDPVSMSEIESPVITPQGSVYDQESIMESLSRVQIDPLNRSMLTAQDLVPDKLFKALDEYYKNPAVDLNVFPAILLDPLTNLPITKAVVAENGVTYERTALEKYLKRYQGKLPNGQQQKKLLENPSGLLYVNRLAQHLLEKNYPGRKIISEYSIEQAPPPSIFIDKKVEEVNPKKLAKGVDRDLLVGLLKTNPNNRRAELNKMFARNSDSINQIKLASESEENADLKGTPAYNELMKDLSRIHKTNELHAKGYTSIVDPDERQQFLLGLMDIDTNSRREILNKQYMMSKTHVESIEKSLFSNREDRKRLFIGFNTYNSLCGDVTRVKNTNKILEYNYSTIQDPKDRQQFIFGLLSSEASQRVSVINFQYLRQQDGVAKIKDFLVDHKEEYESYPNYNAVLIELDRASDQNTKALLGQNYHSIQSDEDRQQFLFGLLRQNPQERKKILAKQYDQDKGVANDKSSLALIAKEFEKNSERFSSFLSHSAIKKELRGFDHLAKLEKYIALRQEQRKTLFGYSKETKITAAEGLIKVIRGEKNLNEIDEKHLGALKQGRLEEYAKDALEHVESLRNEM